MVGFYYSTTQSLKWKHDVRANGLTVLSNYNYYFPNDPQILFEYEFIDKLAEAIRKFTDTIVDPAIR